MDVLIRIIKLIGSGMSVLILYIWLGMINAADAILTLSTRRYKKKGEE